MPNNNNGKRKTMANSPAGLLVKAVVEGKHTGKLTSASVLSIVLLGWYGYQEFKGMVDEVIEDARKELQDEMDKAKVEWQAEVAELELQTINEVKRIYKEVQEMHPGPKVHIGEPTEEGSAGRAAEGEISPMAMEMVAQIEEAPMLPIKVKAALKEKAEKGEVKKFLLDDTSSSK